MKCGIRINRIQYRNQPQSSSAIKSEIGKIIAYIGITIGILGILLYNLILGPIAIILGATAITLNSKDHGVTAMVFGFIDIAVFLGLMYLFSIS